ncbi:MAG: hypothetical protein DSY82_05815 [Flavobacteriia bacterium]|nr:MAG: hypothetical protein DSY82_05815 [Flavobacteriia bacterium]
MLEWLVFALLASSGNGDLTPGELTLPKIEILQPAKIPRKNADKVAPKLLNNEKSAVLAIDMGTGKMLISKRANRPQEIASLTKLMTALIILENHDLDEVVTIPLKATEVIGAKADFYQYEKVTVKTLLEAALIPSANDAAMALAIFDAGTEANFVKKMNAKARELGLNSAKFYNPTGLDHYDEVNDKWVGNKMSARDLATLAKLDLRNDFFRETVKKRNFAGTSVDGQFFHEKPSTNQLFDTFLNLKGVKTGYTELAGQCFISLGETDDGNDILTVVLGSPDRFGETKKLLSWIYDSFVWE